MTTIEYPNPDNRVTFQKYNSLYPQPFVSFLDFESLNKKNEDDHPTQIATQHPFAYKYSIINIIDTPYVEKETMYVGEDCVNDMLTNISNDWKGIQEKYTYPINISNQELKIHRLKSVCDICQSKFNTSDKKKTCHHFHYKPINNYASTLCACCNLKLKTPQYLPILVHNLSYDLSLILKDYDEDQFKVEVNKKQGMNFYSATIGKLRFIDSCNMLKGSLSSLAKQHIMNKGDLTLVKASLSNFSSEAQDLLVSSGK